MTHAEPLQIQRISVFMPQRLRDDEVERVFIMRQDIFGTLIDSIKSERPTSIPQHHLLVGQRGMGKTMLLKRIDVALRKEPLNKSFIPLNFPEEQYNIDRLSKFWLNSLDAIADALQHEGDEQKAFELDGEIAALATLKNEQELSQRAYETLQRVTKSLSRRPVLLLDNLNLIFDRLNETAQSKLRKLINEPGAPIFIGASPETFDENLQYDAPFYDAFAVHYLTKLDFRQTLSMLRHLAQLTDQKTLLSQLNAENRPRIETLHALTGGNVRTVVILFSLIAQGFSSDVFQDLEALIDQMTPLYKSRFEELAPQAQVVVDAIALNWDPCTIETLRERTSLENNQLSAQLDRLGKSGWISKLGKRKAARYEISERFFNVWYLLRRAMRRQRQDMIWLTRFMQVWFTRPELVQHAKTFMRTMHEHENVHKLAYGLAMARALPNQTGEKLKEKIYQRLLEIVDGDVVQLEELVGVNMAEVSDEMVDDFNQHKSWNCYIDASAAEWEGELETAQDLYIKAIKLYENNGSAWRGLGSVYEAKTKYHDAEFAYKKAIEVGGDIENSTLSLANLLSNQDDRVEETRVLFEIINKRNPERFWVWSDYGYFLYSIKDFLKAEEAFKKAIELYPKGIFSLLGLADVLQYGLKKYGEAEKYYLGAIKANNRLSLPRVKYGLFLIFRERHDEAEDILRRATSLKRKDALTFFVLGNHLLKQGRYVEAEYMIEESTKLSKINSLYWRRLGELNHYHLHNYKKAKSSYEQAYSLEPKSLENMSNMICLDRDSLNSMNTATTTFSEMEEEFVDSTVVLLHKATFSEYYNDWENAYKVWSDLLKVTKEVVNEEYNWFRSAAVAVRLGYGEQLLSVFRETGHDRIWRPFYEAIKALTLDSEDYLKTEVAAEVREVALKIFSFMKDYNQLINKVD